MAFLVGVMLSRMSPASPPDVSTDLDRPLRSRGAVGDSRPPAFPHRHAPLGDSSPIS